LCSLSSISSTFSADEEKSGPERGVALVAPTPEDELFGKEYESTYRFDGDELRKKLKELEGKFPGFRMIEDHLTCKGCIPLDDLNEMKTKPKLPLTKRFACLMSFEAPQKCAYLTYHCQEYAFLTLVLEEWPNEDEALAILAYLKGYFYYANFFELQKVENPEEAKLVIYGRYNNHYGIYRGNGVVDSKWGGEKAIYRHNLFQHPYPKEVSFYKVACKKLPPNFVEKNWPNPLWKRLHGPEQPEFCALL
jgi:hypothetical protein